MYMQCSIYMCLTVTVSGDVFATKMVEGQKKIDCRTTVKKIMGCADLDPKRFGKAFNNMFQA